MALSIHYYFSLYPGSKEKPDVRDNGDGTYDVTYKPPKEGTPVVVSVKWNGKDIPNT